MKRFDCVFQVDAGPGIGLGHLNRSLTLASALKKKKIGKIALATRTPSEINKHSRTFPLINIPEQLSDSEFWRQRFAAAPPKLAILDSYRISEQTLKDLKSFLPRVAVIDDYHHLKSYPVDIIMNYNPTASRIRYRTLPKTHQFLGLKYALINPALNRKLETRGQRKLRLYVSLGGSPEIPDLLKIASALRPFKELLRVDMARGLSDNSIPIHESFIKLIPAHQAQAAMMRCQAAFIAVGVTVYELGMLGIPALLGITAVNQEAAAREISNLGFFENVGWIKKITVNELKKKIGVFFKSFNERKIAALKAKKVLDGKGSERLASALIKIINGDC